MTPIKPMNPEAKRLSVQLAEMNARKSDLVDELARVHERTDKQWKEDRIKELEWVNSVIDRTVKRLNELID